MRIHAVPALLAASLAGIPAAGAPVATGAKTDAESIASAESAGPPSIAKAATIVSFDAEGHMRTLREGTNGFTCVPDVVETPGPDPMCADAGWLQWMDAWVAHKPPPDGLTGVGYMLAGGSDPDNLDPFAVQPPEGREWVTTGPHLMLFHVGADLAAFPTGPQPDTSKPYVMYPGTPYAHIMAPVE